MRVKICGLSTQEAVERAVEAGASHLGFIMSASRRQVSPEKVALITQNLPQSVKKVGVFVNEPLDFVENAVRIAGFDLIQLHGNENMDYVCRLNLPVIKAVHSLEQARFYENVTLLFDYKEAGSGRTFDWKGLANQEIHLPYFVAGGLTIDNVESAIEHFPNAYGLDVSSGVETNGVKDLEKIQAFISKAKNKERTRKE